MTTSCQRALGAKQLTQVRFLPQPAPDHEMMHPLVVVAAAGPDPVQPQLPETETEQQPAGLDGATVHRGVRRDSQPGHHRVAAVVLDEQADDAAHDVLARGGDGERVAAPRFGLALAQAVLERRRGLAGIHAVEAEVFGNPRVGVGADEDRAIIRAQLAQHDPGTGQLDRVHQAGASASAAGPCGGGAAADDAGEVDVVAARLAPLAQQDAPGGVGDDGAAEHHCRRQLRPAAQRAAVLADRRRQLGADRVAIDHLHDQRDALLRGQPVQILRADSGQPTVEQRPAWLEVEPLDVEQAAVAGVHEDRDPPRSCVLTCGYLDVGRIAFLDEQVKVLEELIHHALGQSAGIDLDVKVRVNLENLPGRDHRLVHAQILHTAADPVQAGQSELVEVREPERAADPLHRAGDRRAVAYRQADDANPQPQQPLLIQRVQLAAVTVSAQLPVLLPRQHVDQAARPRVPHPGPVGPRRQPVQQYRPQLRQVRG